MAPMELCFSGSLHDFCRIVRGARHEHDRRPVAARVTIGLGSGVKISFTGKDFNMFVPDSGGPFVATISNFVDAKNNPVVDTDVPAWASSDDTIAAVVPDPANPQSATVTLAGPLGQVQITATFGDPAAGGFVVTGILDVIAGPAVSATMAFAGPGVGP